MVRKLLAVIPLVISLAIVVSEPSRGAQAQGAGTNETQVVACRVMESFQDERLGTSAILFHHRDKADGPRLGALLSAHSNEMMEIETADGRRHRVTVFRVKSCFGRGLLMVPREIKLAEGDEFVLRFREKD